jgi:hypothetical protein
MPLGALGIMLLDPRRLLLSTAPISSPHMRISQIVSLEAMVYVKSHQAQPSTNAMTSTFADCPPGTLLVYGACACADANGNFGPNSNGKSAVLGFTPRYKATYGAPQNIANYANCNAYNQANPGATLPYNCNAVQCISNGDCDVGAQAIATCVAVSSP